MASVDPDAAEEFLRLYHTEFPDAGPVAPRLAEVAPNFVAVCRFGPCCITPQNPSPAAHGLLQPTMARGYQAR